MGKASITIAVGALWNGQAELAKAQSAVSNMAQRVSQLGTSTTSQLANSGKAWQDFGKKIWNIGDSMTSVGATLTKSITVPATALGTYCVSQAKTFDTALTDLNKTADLTSSQLEEFGDAALEASKTSPVTASEILEAEALGAQLGITADNLQTFSDVANGLDIATSMDMETAATQMAQFANITGMSQDELTNYGSTIVDLGNHLATTESDISSMALRLAGMTTSANFSSAEVLGLAGAMSSLGINAEAGGSAMTQVVATITKQVATGGEQLEQYASVAGMTAEEFSDAWKNEPISALEAVVDGIASLSNQGQAADVTLSQLGITSIRQCDIMRRLAGNTDVMHEALDRANTAWTENTALTTEVEKRNESLESRFDTLKNKVDAAAVEIGTPLAEALLDVADDFEPVISAIGDACQSFADMDSSSQSTILAIAGIATAAGPVLTVLGNFVKMGGNVVTAFGNGASKLAVFGDALNTTDGAAIRVYSSTDTLTAKLGTNSNAAVQAAGCAKNYVSAWENMTDAAKTVTTSLDKINSNNEKLTTASGKAAAKLKEQNAALESQKEKALAVYQAQAELVSAYSGSTKEAEKAVTAAEQAAKGYKESGSKCSELRDALSSLSDETAAAEQSQRIAANTSKTFGSALESVKSKGATVATTLGSLASNATSFVAEFVKANAVELVIMGIATAIGYLYTQYQKAQEHAQLFADATQDVADVIGGAKGSVSGMGDSLSDLTVDVDGTLESLQKLNQSVGEMFTSYYTSSAKLDQYVATIDELAGKSNLTASEQYRLKEAVDGYNQVCGTSYTVTDELNGVLSDASGNQLDLSGTTEENTDKIRKNTDALNANATAWKNKALAEAYSSKAAEYLEAQVDASLKLKDANAKLEAAQDEYNEKEAYFLDLLSQGVISQEEATTQLGIYKDKVSEAQSDVDGLSEAEKKAGDNAKYLQDSASIAAAGLNQTLTEAIAQQEGTFTEMGQKIADSLGAGITAGTTTVETATEFMNSGVVSKVSELSESTQPYGQVLAQRLAAGIGDGSVSVQEATEAMNTLAQKGVTGLSEYYSSKGWELPDSFAAAITANSSEVTTSTDNMKMLTVAALSSGDATAAAQLYGGEIPSELASAIDANNSLPEGSVSSLMSLLAIKLTDGDAEAAAKLCGGNIDEGLAEGIENGTLSESAAQYLGEDVIEKMRDSLGVHSPSTYAIEAGGYIDEGLTQGIQNNQQGPLDAVSSLGTSLITGLANLGTDFLTKGTEAATNLGTGLGAGVEGVAASAAGLATSAATGVSTVVADLGATGSSASSSFASGVGAFVADAYSAASSLASNAQGGSNPAISFLSSIGSSAGSLFSSMINSFSGAASAAGSALASAAQGGSSAVSGYLSSTGSRGGSSFSSGVSSASGSAHSAGSSLASSANSGASGWNAYTSGSHLGNQFASGIGSAWSAVKSFASSLVSAAKSVMGFSVPKEGPWSGAEKGGVTSGRHLGENWAAGIKSSIPTIKAAAALATSAASVDGSLSLGTPSLSGFSRRSSAGQSVQVTNNNVYINGAQVNNLSNRAQDLLGELFNEFSTVARMG